MTFPEKYKILTRRLFKSGDYELLSIRYEDRYVIMRWRNEQMYHLRQQNPLQKDDQDQYFSQVVAGLFDVDYPDQILFSFIKKGQLVGYGGLVHINWNDRNAEISFLMDTEKEKKDFELLWLSYLSMLKIIAFDELKLHKLYTYAFDVRPFLYPVLERAGFHKEAVLKEHCRFEGQWKDVVIHSFINPEIEIRLVVSTDSETLFTWANDQNTRKFSFHPDKINFSEHESWLHKKLEDDNAILFICTVKQEPAAFLRFDKSENDWIIGINISPDFRNKKLGELFLRKAVNEIREGHFIRAYIKPENTASIRTFEKAGFRYDGETTFSGHPALLYKYILNEK